MDPSSLVEKTNEAGTAIEPTPLRQSNYEIVGARSNPEYHPEQVPPSYDDALFHMNSLRFGYQTGAENCKCCHNPKKTQYKFGHKIADLISAGSTVPLFFSLIISLACFCLLASTLYLTMWAAESIRHRSLDWTKEILDNTGKWVLFAFCLLMYPISMLMLNTGHKQDQIFNLIVHSKNESREVESRIMVCDLSYGEQLKEEYLASWIKSRLKNKTKPFQIEDIYIFNFETRLAKIDDSFVQTKAALERIISTKDKITDPEVRAYVARQQILLKKQSDRLFGEYQKALSIQIDEKSAVHRHNIAIVTFAAKDQADNVIKSSNFEILKFYLLNCCRKKKAYHSIHQAPEPNDLRWENFGISSMSRFRRFLLTNFVFLILYTASITIQISGIVIENRWFKKLNDETSDDSFLGYILSLKLVSALIIQSTNLLFSRAIRWSADSQSDLSHTEADLSYTKKLVAVQSLNTIATTLVLSFVNSEREDIRKLSSKLSGQLFVNGLWSVLAMLYSPSLLYRNLRIRCKVNKRRDQNKPILMTQSELNKLLEFPQFNMPQHCAAILKTYLMTFFCISIAPFGCLWCVAVLLYYSAFSRTLLVRSRSLTRRTHESFSVGVRNLARLGGVFSLAGNLIFSIRADIALGTSWSDIPSLKLNHSSFIPQLIVLFLAILHTLIYSYEPDSLSVAPEPQQANSKVDDSLTNKSDTRTMMRTQDIGEEGLQADLANHTVESVTRHTGRRVTTYNALLKEFYGGVSAAQNNTAPQESSWGPSKVLTRHEIAQKHRRRLQALSGRGITDH